MKFVYFPFSTLCSSFISHSHNGNGSQQMENPIKLQVVSVEFALPLAAVHPGRRCLSFLRIPGKYNELKPISKISY